MQLPTDVSLDNHRSIGDGNGNGNGCRLIDDTKGLESCDNSSIDILGSLILSSLSGTLYADSKFVSNLSIGMSRVRRAPDSLSNDNIGATLSSLWEKSQIFLKI